MLEHQCQNLVCTLNPRSSAPANLARASCTGTSKTALKGPLHSKAGSDAHQGIVLKLLGIKVGAVTGP